MIRMTVRHDVPRIRNGHMAEKKHGFDIRRVGQVFGLNQSLHTLHGIILRHIVTKNRPTIASEVLAQTLQLRRKVASVGVLDNQDQFTAVLNHRHIHPRIDVTRPGIRRRNRLSTFDDLIFVGNAVRHSAVGMSSRFAR